ncbi:MAG: hypothetical protein A4E57_03772 [Syntrophorhabdaceae bacterium PtaU1.Bin034]|nr:MAG: hypothetical protein A4E57_03772 [Syntrophorhabdaceae bacterium PtaU1.Bin034]
MIGVLRPVGTLLFFVESAHFLFVDAGLVFIVIRIKNSNGQLYLASLFKVAFIGGLFVALGRVVMHNSHHLCNDQRAFLVFLESLRFQIVPLQDLSVRLFVELAVPLEGVDPRYISPELLVGNLEPHIFSLFQKEVFIYELVHHLFFELKLLLHIIIELVPVQHPVIIYRLIVNIMVFHG